jgi:restriction system protein
MNLSAKVGFITAALLFMLGWALPLLFSDSEGFASLFVSAGRNVLWAIAFVVTLGAALGTVRRRADRGRFDSTVNLDDLSWQEFEGYLAEYFRRRGSTVTYRGGDSADGGVDLVLDDVSGRRIVQAKHWKVRSVGVVPLRALWGVLDDERAQGAVCVTSGDFTLDAVKFAKGKRLELIGRDQLLRLVAEVKGGGRAAAPSPQAAETCPQCKRGVLGRKLARRGRNAGSYFLSCNRFPDCRYTRSL